MPNKFQQIQPRDTRRYHYVKQGDDQVYGGGKDETCPTETQAVDSWKRWLFKCGNCFCLCDDKEHSDRFFSLKDVVSNIAENRFV